MTSRNTPSLGDRELLALIAEEYWSDGVLANPANVIWLRSMDGWHRLFFEGGEPQWRESNEGPRPYEMPELQGEVRLKDLANQFQLNGEVIQDLKLEETPDASELTFRFKSGRRIVFQNREEATTYAA